MEPIRHLHSVPLILLSLHGAALNARILYLGLVRAPHVPSFIPLLPGVFGTVGFAVSLSETLRRWWWLPLFYDLGTVPLNAYAVSFHLRRCSRASRYARRRRSRGSSSHDPTP